MLITSARVLTIALSSIAIGVLSTDQASRRSPGEPIRWNQCLRQTPEWYSSDEAVRVADNLLLYQRMSGGWDKNVDMAVVLSESQKLELIKQKAINNSNIDNGATYTQLTFLARVYSARRLLRHKEAFIRGLDYLLAAQYDNGGWPQYYPEAKGYSRHITFNDGAMIGVLTLLRDIAEREVVYRFVDETRRTSALRSVRKGIECVLRTQIVVQGRATVWCSQHAARTLAPAAARTFEPISLSAGESTGIVRFLMSIDQPGKQVIEAIENALHWFRISKLTGIRWVEIRDPANPNDFDRVVVNDPDAGPIWARFYQIGTNRPIFAGRDGVVRYNVAEIGKERRTGYQWYVVAPLNLLETEYPAWMRRLRRRDNGKD